MEHALLQREGDHVRRRSSSKWVSIEADQPLTDYWLADETSLSSFSVADLFSVVVNAMWCVCISLRLLSWLCARPFAESFHPFLFPFRKEIALLFIFCERKERRKNESLTSVSLDKRDRWLDSLSPTFTFFCIMSRGKKEDQAWLQDLSSLTWIRDILCWDPFREKGKTKKSGRWENWWWWWWWRYDVPPWCCCVPPSCFCCVVLLCRVSCVSGWTRFLSRLFFLSISYLELEEEGE